jgi:GT2 family glycosyltransferase
MDATIIIVTYNSASCIGACLASTLAQTGVTSEVIVVDNASTDDTLAVVGQFNVRILANRENVGFGRANNRGFAACAGRFVYLLNPDAELAGADALAEICRALAANERWGMAGTRILGADGTGETEPATTYPGQRHVSRDFSRLPGPIAWVLGASMVIRREVYAAAGGFDPGFFLYSEETDFCLRVREAGHEIGFINQATVRHIGGKSETGSDPYAVTRRKMTGLHRFWQKHYSPRDCARLVRRDLIRARFRTILYRLRSRFQISEKTQRKQQEYRAIWETSKDFLAKT